MAVLQGFLFVIILVGHGCLVSQARASDCNNLLADIVFILDSSGSVGGGNFTTMKNFLVQFVQRIASHVKPSSVRVAVIKYDTTATSVFGLKERPFTSEVISAINGIQYTGGVTYTDLALDLAKSILSSNGDRPYATKLAVLLTDGQSTYTAATRVKAQELRDLGTRIMAIGVGGANRDELDAVASSANYVYYLSSFSSLSTIQEELVDIACEQVCSWHGDFCWPGSCSNNLAQNCVCHPGFILEPGTAKRCQLESGPELLTCRVTLKDSNGNEVRSRSSGTSQHCSNQQHEFMNFQPVSVVYDLKAHLDLALGSSPYYVSQSKVGVVGIKVKVTKISTTAKETTVKEVMLNQAPVCKDNANATNPSLSLDCNQSLAFSAPRLADGEQLCIDIEAQGGGFYELQDYESNPKGNRSFPTTSTHRRVCFTLDSTKPQHCSQSGSCTRSPLQLSTRLTRSPEIGVVVDQWMDPVPQGGSASQVSKYILEVHGVDVSNSFLEVQHTALNQLPLNGSAPYDVAVTLPPTEPWMYAIVLEVHDVAGNVAYARRLVLYDNTSVIDLDPHHSLVVVSANPDVGRRWQSADGDVCVDLTDRFYNDVYDHRDYMLPVKEDTGREIRGQYDQISGTLPVDGTPSVRGVVKFEVTLGEKWRFVSYKTTQNPNKTSSFNGFITFWCSRQRQILIGFC